MTSARGRVDSYGRRGRGRSGYEPDGEGEAHSMATMSFLDKSRQFAILMLAILGLPLWCSLAWLWEIISIGAQARVTIAAIASTVLSAAFLAVGHAILWPRRRSRTNGPRTEGEA